MQRKQRAIGSKSDEMKNANIAMIGIALTVGLMVGLALQRVGLQVVAQDAPKGTEQSSTKGDEEERKPINLFPERTSPTFFVEDLVDVLKKATEPLMEQKLTRSSDELRKELDRTTVAIPLAKATTTPLSSQELYRRAAESVFLVAGLTKPTGEDEEGWQTAFSTAFVVHEDGILATSAHVFDHDDHDDAVVAMDVRGQVFPVLEVLAADRKSDTCLFRIATKGLEPLPLGSMAFPGTQIHVMGHPGDSFYYFSVGHIANYERDHESTLWLNVTADFGQGASGGPVMDIAGNVIGQVSRTYTLYAGVEEAGRRRPAVRSRQAEDQSPKADAEEESKADHHLLKRPDPQMVFKSCTPVVAIRALVK